MIALANYQKVRMREVTCTRLIVSQMAVSEELGTKCSVFALAIQHIIDVEVKRLGPEADCSETYQR